ncbi:MAG: NAD(+)/NADH kinase [Actinobacteria bacterium]|jgi:NAD+ kinase|nr:MAG: NAD(+)/NADH kinase [Actinomycetota bacterium]
MANEISTIGIMPHAYKKSSLDVAGNLLEWLSGRGIDVHILREDAQAMGCPEKGSDNEEFASGLELVVSLGGDGAMLRASAAAYAADVPVVGINLGKKGFLTAMDADGMYPGLEEILAGRYMLQERMLLACSLGEEDSPQLHYALNEVAVGKRELQRMIRLEVDINGRYFHFYAGDGVIFSTPTGSTAYSLSAGGPIVDPLLDCIILTPICSHSLMDRSVIISPESYIEVQVQREKVMPTLSFDGREETELPRGGRVLIRRAERRLKMIKLQGYSFYSLLRAKFDFPDYGK